MLIVIICYIRNNKIYRLNDPENVWNGLTVIGYDHLLHYLL